MTGSQPTTREVATEVAEALGTSETTYRRAGHIVAAAEANPEQFGDLVERMDGDGTIGGAYKELKDRRQSGELANGRQPSHPGRRLLSMHELIGNFVEALRGLLIATGPIDWCAPSEDERRGFASDLRKMRTQMSQIIGQLEGGQR